MRVAPTLLHSGAVKHSCARADIATLAAAWMMTSLLQLEPEMTNGFLALLSARAISPASGKFPAEGACGQAHVRWQSPNGRDRRERHETYPWQSRPIESHRASRYRGGLSSPEWHLVHRDPSTAECLIVLRAQSVVGARIAATQAPIWERRWSHPHLERIPRRMLLSRATSVSARSFAGEYRS